MFKTAGHGQFDKLLEKATSNLLLEPDWASIMQICDLIRQKDCQPKYAVAAIKKKLYQTNPHVSMFGLQVLESIVKNCGSPVHDEVATKPFMEELRELAKTTQHENVREKILELIQTWAHAFRRLATYRAVQDVLNIMKAEGAKFPPLAESDAMFVSDTAPEWADSATCHRCRVEFGLMVRKHHCRACGQVFCGKCTTKTATLPKFGIEKEVRVCDACFEKVAKDGVGLEDPEELIIKTGSGQPLSMPQNPQQQQGMPQQQQQGMPQQQQQGIPPHMMQQQQQLGGPPHGTSQQSIPLQVAHPPQQQMGQQQQPIQPQPQMNQQHPQPQYFTPQQSTNLHSNHAPPSNPPPDAINSVPVVKEEPSTAELISFD